MPTFPIATRQLKGCTGETVHQLTVKKIHSGALISLCILVGRVINGNLKDNDLIGGWLVGEIVEVIKQRGGTFVQ